MVTLPQAGPAGRGFPANLVDVPTAQKAPRLAALLLFCFPVLSQNTPPPSSAGVFPLAGIYAGLHGTAYTVFEGTVPEPFGVDILGVLHNAQGPGEDLILARLTGTKAEYTGVVAGMSGSPVYIDGKLVGALAFRIGEFSKEPIAGITPIAQMLAVRDLDSPSGRPFGSAPAAVATTEAHPIETPLVFTGFSPAALDLWKQHVPALGLAPGMAPQAGLGGGQGSPGAAQGPPLGPGSAVSALLVSGDMEIAATCTVTYLDAGHLLACGHPLTQFGAVSLPMTEAEVVATLASPAGSFKIVNTGRTVGAFTQDRQTAIGGLLGMQARMIPVEIALHREGGTTPRTLHLRVLDQPQLTPTALLVTLFQALQETPEYAEEDSYRVHATVQLAGYPPVEVRTLSAPGGLFPAPLAAALNVSSRFSALYNSGERRSSFAGVHIDVEALPGRRADTLLRAEVEQTSIHSGDRINVSATIAPYRGEPRTLHLPVTLPASLPSGDLRLLVSDGPTLDRMLAAGRSNSGTPLSGTVAQLNSLHPDDQLYLTLLAPSAGVSVEGQALGSVPLSIANLLVPAHERDRGSLHSESAETLATVPLHASFVGEQVLTIRVE